MIEKVGDILEGTVVRVYPNYAIMLFESGSTGLLHISEITDGYIRNFTSYVAVGNIYRVKVIEVDEEKQSMKVSVKQLTPEERKQATTHGEIPEEEISFKALEERLEGWIKEENKEERTKMIKLNLDNVRTQIDFDSYKEKIATIHEWIENKTGKGADYLGWADYPNTYDKEEFERIKAAARRIRENYEILVVCGIGGSYLGARAAIEAIKGLHPNDKLEVIYMGQTFSPSYVNQVLNHLKGKKFAINVISKSGTTTETSISFRLLKELMEKEHGKEYAKEAIFATTDKEKGALLELSKKEGYERFVLPSNIGGRYSVTTAVGLLPIAAAGINIDKLMEGYRLGKEECSKENLEENDCYRYAIIRHEEYKNGKKMEMFITYEPALTQLGEWFKQLFGESEGKEGKSLFPVSLTFSTDLHSLGQFIQEGTKCFFETTLKIKDCDVDVFIPHDEENLDGLNYLEGKSLSFVNEKALEGTVQAHTEDGNNDNVILELDKMDAKGLGYLFYFFERACAVSAYLNGVNPFDQPGVEIYKKNMFHLLGKPGF